MSKSVTFNKVWYLGFIAIWLRDTENPHYMFFISDAIEWNYSEDLKCIAVQFSEYL